MQGSRLVTSLLSFVLLLGILIAINVLSGFYYTDIDLTEDKRFTLNPNTYDLVEELEEELTIEVLLEGDFPSSFKRLQNATENLLKKLRSHNPKIKLRWINPMSGTEEENIDNGKRLQKDNIYPINLTQSSAGGNTRKAVLAFPYAVVRYQRKRQIVSLLETTGAYNKDYTRIEAINPSINLLEYKFASAIQTLLEKSRPRVVLLKGHGELARPFTLGLENALLDYYDIGDLRLDDKAAIDTLIDVVLIIKPTRPFPDQHLFMIDQYLMRGGKVIWMVDAFNMEDDSLRRGGIFMPQPRPLEINNLLFTYGVRINPNIVMDWESSVIPVNVSPVPNAQQIEGRRWFYHPRVAPYMMPLDAQATGEDVIPHPIVQNLDFVQTRYPASIDTIKTRTYIQKTPLLRTSPYSKVQFSPLRVSLETMRLNMQQADFTKESQNVAVLLEGAFSSHFRNRVTPQMLEGLQAMGQPFIEQGRPTKMIVVSDGDIAKNYLKPGSERSPKPQPLALGENPFDGFNYANEDFIMNSIEYLIDNRGIITMRNRQVKMRPLNQARAYEEKLKWQLINLLLPLLVLAVLGIGYIFVRRRRFS